ncbi:Eukaryotic translation initiation factor 3 subunit A [Orchesella cincta]|uniref:Eukaryotic translation initiation factor 3 subunit A n=1 Tax=Orchesella cincta TaxID=48709 RepID=A0A1D2MBZ9_ORCCI|nr:Eukaryotic translation initiation factor 3 subunit A [Orchesella cincta]
MVAYKPSLLVFAGLVALTTIISYGNCAPRPYRGSSWDGDAGWDLGGRALRGPSWNGDAGWDLGGRALRGPSWNGDAGWDLGGRALRGPS